MARLVLALLVLVCLVAVCRSTYEADLRRQLRTHECRRLIKVLSKCGYKKRWTTQLQKDLAATMAQRTFHDDLNSCLSMSLNMEGNMSYCKHEPSMRIYLQCSRMALFKRVDVKNKFAAIKFHGGYDHCVKVHMGMMDEFGELPVDDDDDDDDDDEDDDGKVESGGQDGRQDKSKSSMMHADGGKSRKRRKTPMYERDEMGSGHSHRKPATEHARPGGGSGRGPDDVIRRRPYDRINRHHGQPYDDDETMVPATEHDSDGQGGGREPHDVVNRRPYDKINRHHGRPYDDDETMMPATENDSDGQGGGREPHDVVNRRPYDKINRRHGRPYDDDETMPRHRRKTRDDDDYMPSDVEPRKSDRRQYPDNYNDDYD